ncbi:MAG: 16S rRNA (cytidine(1402)-2'-O)-methyltransferase [Anaerolineae bacterium]|nr:16S rRNA (cytidine(1402)-2'-O)-methyltransferase [Anaerolineae bacterium]
MSTLYVVGTPIGNLEDITLRALRVLREVSLIAAEDTRSARVLLRRYDLHTPLTSYTDAYARGKRDKIETNLSALSQGDVALISEAGMPGISDPGYELIRAALDAGHSVVPVPGPSALTAALAVSGLPADRFLYLGFLPRRAAERRDLLRLVASQSMTLVAFETPHRLRDALDDLAEILGVERPLAVARELTKLHEEIWRGIVGQAQAHFTATEPKGEFTLVIGGAPEARVATSGDEAEARKTLQILLEVGVAPSLAARAAARLTGWPRRVLYAWATSEEETDDEPG